MSVVDDRPATGIVVTFLLMLGDEVHDKVAERNSLH